MFDPRVGMKIYDNAWYLRHRLEPEQAADILAGMGVTYRAGAKPAPADAGHRNRERGDGGRCGRVSQRSMTAAFRDALRARGIAYFASLNIGFDPSLHRRPPRSAADRSVRTSARRRPTGTSACRRIGRANIDHKLGLLERAVEALEPDGVHLGFIRWPGFWEIWLPDVSRADMPDYCYGPETLSRFCREDAIDSAAHRSGPAAAS